MEDRARKIIEACLQEKSKKPVDIFLNIAHMDFVRIHGPEHHVLDGAALLQISPHRCEPFASNGVSILD